MYLTGFPSYNALKNYEHMRPGHCGDGYYRGWDDDEDHTIMDAEKCAMLCDKEPECVYLHKKSIGFYVSPCCAVIATRGGFELNSTPIRSLCICIRKA
jgi:hypothetical protein